MGWLAVAMRRAWACQRMVPTRCGLGNWRLDGAACGASKEGGRRGVARALSPGGWHQHHGGSVVMTAIDQHSRMTRCLGGNAACQRFVGEAAGKGMRREAHRALEGAPWRGAWPEFHLQAARRGAEEGDRFGRVPGTIAGWVRNGFLSRRRETDVWGLQDIGGRLAVTRGGKWHGPASQRWAGPEVL
jgi:hypothetical protein